jgi:hypothetical protein
MQLQQTLLWDDICYHHEPVIAELKEKEATINDLIKTMSITYGQNIVNQTWTEDEMNKAVAQLGTIQRTMLVYHADKILLQLRRSLLGPPPPPPPPPPPQSPRS